MAELMEKIELCSRSCDVEKEGIVHPREHSVMLDFTLRSI